MLTQEQIVRLQDIGFSACHCGLVHEGRLIFDALLSLNPQSGPARLGKALSHLVVDEFSEAEKLLGEYLAEHPEDTEAEVLLGLCLGFSGRPNEARALLAAKNYPAGTLAHEILDRLG